MAGVGCNCSTTPGAAVPRPYFEPVLANQPLTFAVSYYPDVPASYSISAISRTGGVVTATLSATPTGVGSGPIIVGGVGDPSYDGQFTLTSVNGTTVTWSQGGADSVSAGGRLYVGTFNASIYDCAQQGLGTVPTGTPGIGLLGAQTGFALGGAITIAGNSVSGWNAKWPISATYAPVFMPPGTAGLPPGAPTTQGLTIVYLVTGTSVPSSIGNGGLAAAWPPASQMPSASSFLAPDTSTATPQITVFSDDGQIWLPTEDLLSKDSDYAGFIPEIEWDGTAHLRFGDGTYGEDPEPGVAFTAMYRTGNGASGNIGRDSLAHILMVGSAGITAVRNPLPAAGGVDPETMQHIVQVAPFAFQSQMRCVTAADYGTMAATLNGVSQAQGTIRWTGSWYSAFVSIDPATTWTNTLASQVETGLEMLRMMGTDLVVEEAVFVGLNIGLEICVSPNFFQGDVYQALWQLLVTGDSCTGTPGLLNAANFQFGQTVYASPIIAAAQSVTGVVAVTLVTFERMTQPTSAGTAPPTQLLMGSVEIPCCNNDPNHADLGFLTLTMDGGK
jgi:hypothetical protein